MGSPSSGPDKAWNTNKPFENGKLCTTTTLPGGVTDCFYNYDTMAFDDGEKDRYFGYKTLAVSYGGTLRMYGLDGATYADTNNPSTLNPQDPGISWARLNTCANGATDSGSKCINGVLQAGANQLVLDCPANLVTPPSGANAVSFKGVNWQTGDEIVISTSDYFPGHSEVATIESVSADGKTITLTAALKFPHNASLYSLSVIPKSAGLTDLTSIDTRATVGLLTRSIAIISGGDDLLSSFPAPNDRIKPNYNFGGHVVIRQGFKEVQLQGVLFYQMGQGGRIGHYPVHFHMARKVPTGTFVKDCSIWDSMTRFIVLHATQRVLLARNVGYQSIGHGYYLEDGTETNNQLFSNLGISARAAVKLFDFKTKSITPTPSNPREVPGILAWPGTGAEKFPYDSDYAHPTVFWSMNTWNDYQFNVAVGAETCGACYWTVPGQISGGSKMMAWTGYASEQRINAGTTPNKEFLGNSCMSASWAYVSKKDTYPCLGVSEVRDAEKDDTHFVPIHNDLLPDPDSAAGGMFYPIASGDRFATKCAGEFTTPQTDCGNMLRCTDGNPNCLVTVLDRFSTAFNQVQTNFAAILLRPQWSLVINSAISDVLDGGLSFVTGGGYTRSDVPTGMWQLARKSVFVGNTQNPEANPFATNGGPFNPNTQPCDNEKESNYCLSAAGGVSMQRDNWAAAQRFFSIYDGPSFQDANSYLDITPTTLTGCDLSGPAASRCSKSAWMEGTILGVPGVVNNSCSTPPCPPTACYLPNAAIAWKQPNGFYYPPAFHSQNLFFDNVAIRHFVYEPFFSIDSEGKRIDNTAQTEARYCNWSPNMFSASYSDVDRQTELSDDDGTLTGLVGAPGIPTISVNQDNFFSAPSQQIECASDIPQNTDGTALTSPYEYVTSVIYPDFATIPRFSDQWTAPCSNQACLGVPIYRNFLNPGEKSVLPIRMSGLNTGQRDALTANNGVYYIDTTVPEKVQEKTGNQRSVFQANQKYHVFVLFGNTRTNITYNIYVGDNFDLESVQPEKGLIEINEIKFTPIAGGWPAGDAPKYSNGVLTVTLKLVDFPSFAADTKIALPQRCQPSGMCTWNGSQCVCSIKPGDPDGYLMNDCQADNSAICSWAVKDIDYPDYFVSTVAPGAAKAGGAYGFSFTLPAGFKAEGQGLAARPTPVCFPNNANWNVPMADSKNGSGCPSSPPTAPQFCTSSSNTELPDSEP